MITDILITQKHWTRVGCKTEGGKFCEYDDVLCTKFTLLGAVYRAYEVPHARCFVIPKLRSMLPPSYKNLREFNDDPAIQFWDILKLVERSGF